MSSLNKVFLMGRIGQDPELKYTEAGTAICNVSLATNDYAGKDKPEVTTWHRVVFFSKTAELVKEHFKKGDALMVEGRISIRGYETKEGEKRTSYEVVGERLHFLPTNRAKKQTDTSGDKDDSSKDNSPPDNLPF